ncbi:dihydrofolate reductase [Gordonia sp. PS3]|uniref:Dihydrofolate reductase n=1 Tax=Gordonia sihwensis NBRC 108236 TaxID=1223544 RepID=L7LIX4_9ACTN|nr:MULTISPECIES: dihydrofolate reductase [Gordonia]AUH69245.1 dihydrofolate reductase [Gordonia sp. YC-JH1]KJR07551.1 dihydrofolate reductase [Gordonia sihwensis]KXT57781.1 dihydrofolate reductase [Gordonia sp. QH-12]MBY4569774.1 dihydrofolate reductase [Gordonia sihwensis]GAC60839.1 dihydrofolate reductase [Gordonia sihwensis NBRC 108236]
MTITLVWAQDRAGAIGRAGVIPWRVPEDMRRFKEITGGSTVIMGRKTWESLPTAVRPLPGRRNIVITRARDYRADGAEIVAGLEAALDAAGEAAAVIGGGEIYAAAIDRATHLRVTEIDVLVDGADAFAPVVDPDRWESVTVGEWLYSSTGTLYRFIDYRRR